MNQKKKKLLQKVRTIMIKEKITALVKKEAKPNKKKIENLVFALILLIVTILIINNVFSKDKKSTIKQDKLVEETISNKQKERDLESDLENILIKIKGIDDVQVLITYSETEKFVPVYNESSSQSTTTEKDTEGGERLIESIDNNKEVISDSNQNPITERVIYPKAEGAIISVKGNIGVATKDNIVQAVSATTGLATHKIQILEMK